MDKREILRIIECALFKERKMTHERTPDCAISWNGLVRGLYLKSFRDRFYSEA